MKQEFIDKALLIIKILKAKGVNIRDILNLLKNNPDLLNVPEEDLKNNLYIIANSEIIYAVLLVNDNNYYWSVLIDGQFRPFVESTAKQNNNDYIIEMTIESINKYAKYTSGNNSEEQNLEEKIRDFSLIKKNKEGYHLK